MNRRHFLGKTACVVGLLNFRLLPADSAVLSSTQKFEVFRSQSSNASEIKTDFEYQLMPERKKQSSGSSALLNEKRLQGIIHLQRLATYLCTLVSTKI